MNLVRREPFLCLRQVLAVLFLLTSCTSVATQPRLSTTLRPSFQSDQARKRSHEDEAFLQDLQLRSFNYFWEQGDPQTGLVPDRARMDGSPLDENHRNVASIAATGFGLTALCIAADRGWINQSQARERARNTVRFFANRAFQERGWFYHWLDAKSGERRWNSEVSSIDTALLLAGVLTVRQYFRDDSEIVAFATKIYERVDFRWMLNGHPQLLSHGWKPETGFLKPRWDTYSEDTILYLLAIGSPAHPISPASWYALWRDRYRYEGYAYFTTIGVPLFMHQYAHAWVDYRNRRENRGDRIDYFDNSIKATLAHRAFCINLAHEFPAFGTNIWGITASDSARGYLAWGGPPRDPAIDGTVVPSAAGGSLMFTPKVSAAALRAMREKYGDRVYGKYGFVDAFNPNTGWIDSDVIGINAGIILLSAENSRTGNVWNWFMRNPEIPRALQRAGLVRYQKKPGELRIRKAAHRRSNPQITQIQNYPLRNLCNLRIIFSRPSGNEI
ncbi:MAG TPA: glucoamylase family protein [Pyrinomonadaceae bacterium]